MNSYNDLCDKTEDIICMLKFLNYAYNQPYYENEAWELGNEERAGGQLILFHIMEELQNLNEGLRDFIKNKGSRPSLFIFEVKLFHKNSKIFISEVKSTFTFF